MKIISLFGGLITSFLVMYASLVVGDATVHREQYVVKVNDIVMVRGSADGILRHIRGNNDGVSVYDKVNHKYVVLSSVPKDADISIENDFLALVATLYEDCLYNSSTPVSFENEDQRCILYKFTGGRRINMCIDKKDKKVVMLGIEWGVGSLSK